jgi:sialic acid synthase SpsE|tara:strand:+ start:235 stop:975 length:741 start_codon:yes stop_codon:yes gene_type:complete
LTNYIAEIGLNHLGDEDRAMKLLKGAVEAGATSVTYQIQAPDYYDGSRVFRVALPTSFYEKAADTAHAMGAQFGLAVVSAKIIKDHNFDNVDFWKILSMDFRDDDLIGVAVDTGKYIYISTGVADIEDIKNQADKYKNANFIHTTLSEKVEDMNISAIRTMKNAIKNDISFGLHSSDLRVALLAMTFRPHSLFFYLKTNEILDYSDDAHAITVESLADRISDWDFVNTVLGSGEKETKDIPDWVYE